MTGSESEVDVSYWRCCKYSHAKRLTGHLASLDWQLLTPCFQQMQTCHSLHRGKVTLRGLHPWEGSTETTADSTAELHCSRPCSSGIFCACWERTMGFGTQWTSWDAGLSLSLGDSVIKLIPRTVTSDRTTMLQGAASVFDGVAMRYFLWYRHHIDANILTK